MKNVAFSLIGICLLCLSCSNAANEKSTGNDRLPDPIIKAEMARVDGKLSNFHLKNN